MRTKMRSKLSLLFIALAAMIAIPAVAVLADTLTVNDVSAGGDTTKIQGASGTAGAVITATNTPTGDASGCNASGGSGGATLTLTSSDAAKVNFGGNASASQVVTGCGTTVNFNYQVPSNAPLGDATITATASGGKTDSKYTPDSFVVTVIAPTPTDTTAPVITPHVNGTLGTNGWYTSDVAVTWDVVDDESAISSKTGCDPSSVTSDTTASGTTLTCEATSAGGTSSESVTIYRDATAPTVELDGAATGTQGTSPWYTSAVSQQFKASDAASGLPSSFTSPFTKSSGTAEGDNVSIDSGTVTDNAGNQSSGTSAGPFKIDLTNPTITGSLNPSTPASTGWYNISTGAPTAQYTCNDVDGDSDSTNGGASGVASCDSDYPFGEDANPQSDTGDVTDNAGRTNSTSVGPVKVDLSKPTNVQFVGGPPANATYDFGSTIPATPTCTASDAISGMPSNGCVVADSKSTPGALGTHTLTATATDNAGNQETATRTYEVKSATTKGFYSPIDMNNVVNTVKGGSTVPAKFELFGGASGTEQKNLSDVSSVSAKQINCSTLTSASDAIEEIVSTNATGLRFDTTGDQFIYNWKTPKSPGTCYSLTMTAADQQTKLVAYFKLT